MKSYLSSVSAIICLASCAGHPLVVHSRTESMHHDMGSAGQKTRIDADGQVWIERDGETVRCQRVVAKQLTALRAAVRKALAARPKPVYDTSAVPGPSANYSVFTTLELSLDGQHSRVRTKGWADVPAELSEVLRLVSGASSGCNRKSP